MRVNVYGEEITPHFEIVKKTVDQKQFVGVRFYLKSHPDLHHSEGDNDQSAVTFWCPWTKSSKTKTSGNDYELVTKLFLDAVDALNDHRSSELQKV